MIIILLGTRRILNDYSCSYGEVIIISWTSPPAPPAAAAGAEGWRLKAEGWIPALLSIWFPVASLRCALSDAPAISWAALGSQSRTNRAVFVCVQADPPAVCRSPRSLLPSFFSSIHSLAFRGRSRRDVGDGRAAKMNPGEIPFTRLTQL